MVLPDGTLLNEGAATLQYIADLAPGSGLAWARRRRTLGPAAAAWQRPHWYWY